MITKTIQIKTEDGFCDSFVAYPEEGGHYKPVIYNPDAYGLRNVVYDMVRKLAAAGYYVLAPNYFYRLKAAPVTDLKFPLKPEDMTEAHKIIIPMVGSYTPDLALRDAAEILNYIAQQKQAQGTVYISGYCMGGTIGVRIAAEFPTKIAGVAGFHAGRLVTDASDSPHKLVSKIKAKMYFGHADKDQSMPLENISILDEAMKKAGLRYKSEVYEGAAHGYTQADLPAYNKGACDRHWEALFKFLKD